MKEIALEFIKIIEDNGYSAYIVGGFVRDYLMNIPSKDIDITTSATPKEIKKIFQDISVSKPVNDFDNYGSIRVKFKNIIFEVTTFRKEEDYLDNRHPSSISYVKDLKVDLQRRDFTINAICINKEGMIIDPLNGKADISKKIIKTIGDSKKSFQDDALRILRAIRFASTLNFKLDEKITEAIKETKHYLKNISYERKKVELDKIFASNYAKEGIDLIKALDLEADLDLENIERVKDYTDVIGIWSMINSPYYKFTKQEKDLIKKVNIVYDLNNLEPIVLYKYGLYVNILAGINKGINKKEITEVYNKLPIKAKDEIVVSPLEICKIVNREPDSFLNQIYEKLENNILLGKLPNNREEIYNYIKKNFEN